MKYLILFISLICVKYSTAQKITVETLGLRHLQTSFKNSHVDILVKSKKGDELKPKPIFLFVQGSLPRPLIIVYDSTHNYPIFPFNTDSLLTDYHIAIISKPAVPLIVEENKLSKELTYFDPKTKEFPQLYTKQNYLDYYVERDQVIIDFLQNQLWVSKKSFVVAGHSEGSSIIAKLASVSKKITSAIYLSGNPLGRIMSIIEQSRKEENDTSLLAESSFTYWEKTVRNKESLSGKNDTYKTTYQFSIPPINYMKKISIPVLVLYGTKDVSAPFNDYMRTVMINYHKTNFTFKAYIGLEHNFFPINADGSTNYDIYNWDKVAVDIYHWLRKKNKYQH